MNRFWGIVDEIKDKHKSGIYGQKQLSKEETDHLVNYIKTYKKPIDFIDFIPYYREYQFLKKIYYGIKEYFKTYKIEFIAPVETNNGKMIFIPYESLNKNFSIAGNEELLYGLFNNFNSPDKAFKTIMNSQGGSDLIIAERNYIKSIFKHYGGETGIFNTGLYTCHPKSTDILIPIENVNELIKSFILEEALRAFEALGAKKIIIEDVTDTGIGMEGNYESVKASGSFSKNKMTLRTKEFGKGTFDPERALKNAFFLPDFPNVMTVIESRKHGNQILEEVTETINLNSNIDVNVIGLYGINSNFKYKRTWTFRVEFFNKKEFN